MKAFGRVDVLVNTVGAFEWKPVAEMDPSEWRAVMASNLDSVYHMSRLVLPRMREQHWGRIVNFGAVGAERTAAQPRSPPLRGQGGRDRVLEGARPRGGALRHHRQRGLPGRARKKARRAPRPRWPPTRTGRPRAGGPRRRSEDVVRAIMFFASPAADFLTGQVLAVAGGAHLCRTIHEACPSLHEWSDLVPSRRSTSQCQSPLQPPESSFRFVGVPSSPSFLPKHLGREDQDLGLGPLPGVPRQTGLPRGLAQELIAIPSVPNRHLRQQDPGAAAHSKVKPVPPGLHLLGADLPQRPQDGDLDEQVLKLDHAHAREAAVPGRGGRCHAGHGLR